MLFRSKAVSSTACPIEPLSDMKAFGKAVAHMSKRDCNTVILGCTKLSVLKKQEDLSFLEKENNIINFVFSCCGSGKRIYIIFRIILNNQTRSIF